MMGPLPTTPMAPSDAQLRYANRQKAEHNEHSNMDDTDETDDMDNIADIEASSEVLGSLSGRTLVFCHHDLHWGNVSILEDDAPVYFATSNALLMSKPDIVLRTGSEDGPLAGQAHFRLGLSIKAGVGTDDTAMEWTKMERGGVLQRHYNFEFRGKRYDLRRTHSTDHGIASHQRAMFSHMKVVEEGTDEVVAVYISTIALQKKRGTVKFATGVSIELQIICLLGFMGWREKIARASGRSNIGVSGMRRRRNLQ